MRHIGNPWRGKGPLLPEIPMPSTDAARVAALLDRCPASAETPMVDASTLLPTGGLWIKDERTRMGLGSFKALGAAYVIARHAEDASAEAGPESLRGRVYVTASAGNHGMSVAAGARLFGARAIVYIAQTVPDSFALRLSAKGAEVRREGADYAASMKAAADAAAMEGATLLSDSSWAGYLDLPRVLMEGYLQMAAEAGRQMHEPPTHILLQAGVGGMAGAVAAYARKLWGNAPRIVVVEPEAAPALQACIEAGRPVVTSGPDSVMGRLDCKEASLIALNGLARDADDFVTLEDEEVLRHLPAMKHAGFETSASGGAGVALAMNPAARDILGIGEGSRVLAILSEVAS